MLLVSFFLWYKRNVYEYLTRRFDISIPVKWRTHTPLQMLLSGVWQNFFPSSELANKGQLENSVRSITDCWRYIKSSWNDAWCLQWEMKIAVYNETTCHNRLILHHLSPSSGSIMERQCPWTINLEACPQADWCGEWVLTEEDLWNSTTEPCHDGKIWCSRWSRWNLVLISYIMEVQGMIMDVKP